MFKNCTFTYFTCVFLLTTIGLTQGCPQGSVYVSRECIACFSLTNTISSQKLFNACNCAAGYKWSQQSVACVKTFNLKTLSEIKKEGEIYEQSEKVAKTSERLLAAACDTAKGFIFKNSMCINCRDIPWSNGLAKNNSSCYCQSPYAWNSFYQLCGCYMQSTNNLYIDGSSCKMCSQISITTASSQQCFKCNGGTFGYSLFGCVNCSSIPYGTGATATSSYGMCNCQVGYTYNVWLGACICNINSRYAISSSNTCQACSSLSPSLAADCMSCSNSFFYSGYVCRASSLVGNYSAGGCRSGYIQTTNPLTNQTTRCVCSNAAKFYTNGNACSSCVGATDPIACTNCNLASGFFLAAQQCIYCKNAPYSTATATASGCLCQANYYWSVLTGSCLCDWTIGYIGTPGSCLSCSSLSNTAFSTSSTRCNCIAGYTWNGTQCVCNPSNGAFISALGKCVNCNTIPGAMPIVASGGVSCACLQGFIWNSTLQQCVCDINQNFWMIKGVCYDCTAVPLTNGGSTSLGCQCAQGLIWVGSENKCGCPAGYVNMGTYCDSCSTITLPTGATVAGCQVCNVSQGFFLSGGICYACSKQKYSTGAATGAGCTCANSSLIWSVGLASCTCVFAKGFTTSIVSGSLSCAVCSALSCSCGYPGTGTIYSNGICTSCASIPNSNGLAVNGACACNAGYAFSIFTYPNSCYCSYKLGYYISTTCKSCASFPAVGSINASGCLLCSSSQGFLYISNDTCIQCSSLPGTNGMATAAGCVCTTGVWNSALFKCVNGTCPAGSIYNVQSLITTGSSCILCSSIAFSTGVPSSTTACNCNPGYVWIVNSNGVGSCFSCNTTTSVLIGSLCYSCLTVKFSTGPIVGTANCACPSELVWTFNAANNTGVCLCSNPLQIPKTDGSSCVCNPTYAIAAAVITACIDCRKIPYSTNITVSGVCGCMPNFVWTNVSSPACVCLTPYLISSGQCACNPALTIVIGGSCFVCANVVNATGASTGTACICNPFTVWNGISCVSNCNSTAVVIGSVSSFTCLNCGNSGTFTLAKLNATLCSCINSGLVWNALGYCDCGPTSAMIITGATYVCVLCSSAIYSTGRSNSYACTCPAPLTWNPATKACDCGSSAIVTSVNGVYSCVVCSSNAYSSGKSLTSNTCICLGSLTWQANSCGCASPLIILSNNTCGVGSITCAVTSVLLPNNTCVSCTSVIYALSKLNVNTCNCLSGALAWNPNAGMCRCSSASAVIFTIGGVYLCVTCNASVYATAPVTATTCACISSSLTWNSTVGTCGCNPISVIYAQGTNYSCVTCNSAVYALSKLNSTTCNCIDSSFSWNGVACACPAGSIITPNFKCLACPTGATISDLTCNCSTAASPNSIWNDITRTCQACGTSDIPNSVAAFYGVACQCISGYIWDVMTNACIIGCPSTGCTINCGKIPNVITTSALSVSSIVVRNIIASASTTIQAFYLAAKSDYISINSMACVCQSGMYWNSITMRCYSLSFKLQ